MSELVVRRNQPIGLRLKQSRPQWTRDGAVVGAVGTYLGAASVAFGFGFHPWLVGCAITGAVAGGLLGYVGPFILNKLRGVLPLPVLALVAPGFAGTIAVSVGSGVAWMIGAPIALSAVYSGVVASMLTAIFWLPYTVATVMDLRRWPVVLTACLLSPLSGLLTKWLWLATLG